MANKPVILIVGRTHSGIKNYLDKHDFDYTILHDKLISKNPSAINFQDEKSILQAVDKLDTPISAVIATYENYVLPAAQISQHLGLPGILAEAALACTDKQLMRQAFAKASKKISPDFMVVKSKSDLLSFVEHHNFPLILKPANLAKSLLITKNHNVEELLVNYQKMIQQIHQIYAKYAPSRQPKILIEEFLEGTIHSVDAFIDNLGEVKVLDQIVDYQTGHDIGYNDNFHYSRILPSKLTSLGQDKLKEVAELGCKALGMKSCPAHIEIIMTSAGPRIVEIGARNGGYRERMYNLANGIDITGAMLAIALGEKPSIIASKNEPCAVLELFPKHPGHFMGINNENQLRNLSSLCYFSIKAKSSQFVGLSSDGYKMCAVIILHNEDSEKFNEDLDFVNNNVYVKTSSLEK